MKFVRLMMGLLVAAVLVTGVVTVFAQEAAGLPTYVVELTADGIQVPSAVPAGLATLSVQNTAEAPGMSLLARLNEGVTDEAFIEAMSQSPEAAIPLVSLYGGTMVFPGATRDITFDLAAGRHVMLNLASEAPAVVFFDVIGVQAPAADVVIELADFAFILPDQIPAGAQQWEIRNVGDQWHEFMIARITDDSLTEADIHDLLMSETEEPPAGLEEAFFWAPASAQTRAWTTIDLEPGRYVIACFLPDFGSGQSHLEMGMIRYLEVTE
jgi:hypothetical protein